MKKRLVLPVIAGITAISLIAGCSSSINSKTDRFEAGPEVAYETTAAFENMAGAGGERYAVSSTNSLMGDEYIADYDGEFLENDFSVPQASPDTPDGVNIDPSAGRLLIRTVSVTAETTNYLQVSQELENQVKAAGGYIEYSSMSGTGKDRDLRTGTYTVRVPADKLDSLISSVGNSCTVTSSNESSSDVTLEYVDTKSRVEALRVEYNQLMELLDQAQDLDTIIILQNRLTDVRYEIERSESRIRVLENQVQYATLNLTLREVLEEKEVVEAHVVTYGEKVSKQFEEMKENTVEFFQNLGLWIISIIPGLVFMAIIAAVVLIIVFSARSKRRKRRAKALAAKEAEAKALAAKEAEAKEAKAKEAEAKKADSAEEKK
ncbi:MAG: DUF4349 domain-containing protein [Clostridiales bacterium]|nr:DUF4349 domain-containing protein [Clostridiales bacterium]